MNKKRWWKVFRLVKILPDTHTERLKKNKKNRLLLMTFLIRTPGHPSWARYRYVMFLVLSFRFIFTMLRFTLLHRQSTLQMLQSV